MHRISKHRIVPGFNKRDKSTIEWIYEHYHTPVYVFVKRLTRGSPETADLVAQTFLALLQHESPFDSKRKLEQFIYTTARNISLSHLRHQRIVRDNSDDVAEHYLSMEDECVKAAEQSAAFHQLIQLGIAILPPRCKDVFLLHYLRKMKNAEIAATLNITGKTVANLKIQGYKRLKEEIDPTNGSFPMNWLGMLLLYLN